MPVSNVNHHAVSSASLNVIKAEFIDCNGPADTVGPRDLLIKQEDASDDQPATAPAEATSSRTVSTNPSPMMVDVLICGRYQYGSE